MCPDCAEQLGSSAGLAWGIDQGGFHFAALEASSAEREACEHGHFIPVSMLIGRGRSQEGEEKVADGASLAGADLRRWYAPFHVTTTA